MTYDTQHIIPQCLVMSNDTQHIIPQCLVMTFNTLPTIQATRLNHQATAALDLDVS